MDKNQIWQYLCDLNSELYHRGVVGEIMIVGGAVFCLVYGSRYSTRDIDAIFEPKSVIYEAARNVAYHRGLPVDWLNDGVKGFIYTQPNTELYYSMSNLNVYVPTSDYLLAMKVLASRQGTEDLSDIRFLISHLGLSHPNQVLDILLRYYPQSMVDIRIQYIVDELFNGGY